MSKISYYWRILATGICFSSFGIGGLVLTLLVFPVVRILPIESTSKIALNQAIIHLTFRFFVWMMQLVGVLKLEVHGRDRLLKKKAALIVANHPSLIDVVILISLLKQADCVVKQGLWDSPFLKGVVAAAGYISNSDPQGLIHDCVNALNGGRKLIIFPEGTRTKPGQPLKFNRGAANMAIATLVDIIPVVIRATPGALGKGNKWYQVPKDGRFHLSVRIDETIEAKSFADFQHTYKSIQVRNLNDYLQNYYHEALLVHE